jgi:methylated-DNA-[protein]-cysteine S-methyltransferase
MSADVTRRGVHHTPLGAVVVTASDAGVSGLRFTEAELPERVLSTSMAAIGAQLDACFAGELRQFDLAVDVTGSPLELAVWKALRDVLFGATVSYGELAAGLDPPSSTVASSPGSVRGSSARLSAATRPRLSSLVIG